jgi:hypothetical protein
MGTYSGNEQIHKMCDHFVLQLGWQINVKVLLLVSKTLRKSGILDLKAFLRKE